MVNVFKLKAMQTMSAVFALDAISGASWALSH